MTYTTELTSSDVVPRGTASPRGGIFTASASVSTPDVLALASVSTNLPRSCYCLKAPIPIPQKPILLLQLIACIKVTCKYEQNRRKISLGLHVNIIYLWFNLIFLNCMLDSTVNDIGQLPCASALILRYTASVLASVSASSALLTTLLTRHNARYSN